jgi:hypothetical protein
MDEVFGINSDGKNDNKPITGVWANVSKTVTSSFVPDIAEAEAAPAPAPSPSVEPAVAVASAEPALAQLPRPVIATSTLDTDQLTKLTPLTKAPAPAPKPAQKQLPAQGSKSALKQFLSNSRRKGGSDTKTIRFLF